MLELQVGHLQAERVLWSNGSTENSMVVDSPGLYWVQVERGHCVEVDSIKVDYEQYAEAFIELNKEETCLGDTIVLSTEARTGYTYRWSTGATGSSIQVSSNGIYWVAVENYCGIAYDTVEVLMEPCTCTVYMPNAFRPESNIEANRGFAPVSDCVYIDYELNIYNRWGARIFHTKNPETTWNGTQNGNQSPAGVYIYNLYYKGFNEKGYRTIETKRGQVTLIR